MHTEVSRETQYRAHPHHPHRQPSQTHRTCPYARGQGRWRGRRRGLTVATGTRCSRRGSCASQVEVGIDVVSDGEQGKVGYSTYPRHRLTGFGGISSAPARADWADFPEASKRYGQSSTVNRPACNAPLEWADREAYRTDIANLRIAVEGLEGAEGARPHRGLHDRSIPRRHCACF